MKTNKSKNVFFVGGETAGPIMPLLAVAETWHAQDSDITPIFLDTSRSVASRVVPDKGYKFFKISAGKFRRYWTIKNFISPFQITYGFLKALALLIKFKPIIVIGAGGYVQVPVILAAWVLRIPRVIHQQDIIPTLSNKLMAPFVNKITTTFEKSIKDFKQGSGFSKDYDQYSKVVWTGNPCSFYGKTFPTKEEAQKFFKLDPDWPTVLIVGGGSGAMGLNQAVAHNLPELLKVAQVVHSSGVGRRIKPLADNPAIHERYHQYEFINHMLEAYLSADVVISRSGIGAITDLSTLGKISIMVPMPNSHQEWNAKYLYDKEAALVIDQTDITPETLAKSVRKILFDVGLQKKLHTNIQKIIPKNSTENFLAVLKTLLHE